MSADPSGEVVVDWDGFVALLLEHVSRADGDQTLPANSMVLSERTRRAHTLRLTIIKSQAFRKALEGLPASCGIDWWPAPLLGETPPAPAPDARPLEQVLRIALEIIRRIELIAMFAEYRSDPQQLFGLLEHRRHAAHFALGHLDRALQALDPVGTRVDIEWGFSDYFEEISRIKARIDADLEMRSYRELLAAEFDPKSLKRKGRAAASAQSFNGFAIRELGRHVPKAAPKRATAIAELLALIDIEVGESTVSTLLRREKL